MAEMLINPEARYQNRGDIVGNASTEISSVNVDL